MSMRSQPVSASVRFAAGRTMLLGACLIGLQFVRAAFADKTPSIDQQLIVACCRVDVAGARDAIQKGANANARFGRGDTEVFADRWDLGVPVGAGSWTPLIALACSSPYPDPPRKIVNTEADLDRARAEREKIGPERLAARSQDSLSILNLLLAHRCNIDLLDDHGASALYQAISCRKEQMALSLIDAGAQVNTATRRYIDGPDFITPLHKAYWSSGLTKALLDKGANPNAKTSNGKTPRDFAKLSDDPNVERLYKTLPLR